MIFFFLIKGNASNRCSNRRVYGTVISILKQINNPTVFLLFCSSFTSHSLGSGYVLLHHVMGGVEGKQGAWAYPEGGMLIFPLCLTCNLYYYCIMYSKGMGAVSGAIAKSVTSKGASIFTDKVENKVLLLFVI